MLLTFFDFNREELCTNNVANTSDLAGTNLTEVLNGLGGSIPVYGTYVAFAKEDAETSTNATAAQIKLGLELPSLAAGTYKIESYIEISCNRTTRSWYTELRLNTNILTQTDKEAKDTTDYVGVSSFDIVDLSGDNSVDITYYVENATTTVTARRAKILVTRIA